METLITTPILPYALFLYICAIIFAPGLMTFLLRPIIPGDHRKYNRPKKQNPLAILLASSFTISTFSLLYTSNLYPT